MNSRSTRVRSKVIALLASLVALWAFAAYVTLQEGTNLLSLTTLDAKIGRPSEALVAALQTERRLSVVYLGDHTASQRSALLDQRRLTDEAANTFENGTKDTAVHWAASAELEAKLADVVTQLTALARAREAVDAGTSDRNRTLASYTDTIDSVFRTYGVLVTLDDETIARFGRTLVKLSRATELLSQEDAMLAGALTSGGPTAAEHTRFVELVGAQRFLYAEAAAELPAVDMARYQDMTAGLAFARLQAIEDQVSANISNATPPALTAATWDAAVQPAFSQLREFILKTTDHGLELAKPVAIGVIVRLALAGGLGLIAVIASIVISITTARRLVRQLERLRNSARDLASYRLPRVVDRLQHGERVDVVVEAPPLDFGRDEIGQVGEAFNQVQETAVRVAVEQAELRRSVRDVFLSLARRSQALLHRQLGLLDAMERRTTDSEELAELFRIDHLATRMRRNAENLIVLSGATAGRAWRKPVPMIDVLRGALAEVEDYTRVTVLPVGSASLLGRAVGDVIHLLAELIENAVSFSPPQTVVRVGGSVVGYGFAIEIEDRGLGLSPEELAAINEQLRNPPEFRLTSTARLGLYVVGKLAERHGIRVRLTESPYGGTTAIVLLPGTLMADDSGEDGNGPDDGRPFAAASVGRHRLPAETSATVRETAHPAADQRFRDGAPTPNGADHEVPLFHQVVAHGLRPAITAVSTGAPTEAATDHPQQAAAAPPAPPAVAPVAPAAPVPPLPPRDPGAPILTPSGLPWRQRQSGPGESPPATPAPNVTPVPPAPPAGNGNSQRAAEHTRSLMASYRSGTLRGRTEAARLAGQDHPAPAWTESTTEHAQVPSTTSDESRTEPASATATVTDSPVTDSPVTDSPVTDSPVADSPVADSPVADSPVADSPVADSPVADSPIADSPIADSAIAEDVAEGVVIETEDVTVDDPTVRADFVETADFAEWTPPAETAWRSSTVETSEWTPSTVETRATGEEG